MPNKHEHTTQAEHNHQFWSDYDLDSTSFVDWVVTGIFYEGVHWVEGFLSTKNEHPQRHLQRRRLMRQYNETRAIAGDLELLKVESEMARYQCYKHTADEIRQDLIPTVDKIKNDIKVAFGSPQANP